ncbi:MAG: serine--tRNA ligase, partial [Pirellulaceae bacterium]
MLDRKYILENIQSVKDNCQRRGETADIDRLVDLERQRREASQEAQELNRQANETSKLIGKAATPAERDQLKEQGRHLRECK